MAKFLDMDGLQHLWSQIKSRLLNKVDVVEGKGLSEKDFTTEYETKLKGIEENANNYVHPTSGANAGTYTKVTVNEAGHVTSGMNPTTLDGYGITSVEASKLTGTIDIERLPHGALERLVIVSTDVERFALTTTEIQKGDTVKVESTGTMYFVVDDTQLTTEEGYEVYTAGAATAVDWSGITNKPDTFVPSVHTHTVSQITDFPTSLKNPTALSINVNGTTTSYDGSSEKTITINESALGITSITNTEIDTIIAS